ncbi:Hypothetical protein A7982_01741 [Minicystis rosea]|nr:Hypothetical protein A7982_01741 [Minicystis rosea]
MMLPWYHDWRRIASFRGRVGAMMFRLALAFTTVAFALSVTACSSLTKPDEIQIVAEPAPAQPAIRQLPNMPAPGGAARPTPAPQPPSGGGCGE